MKDLFSDILGPQDPNVVDTLRPSRFSKGNRMAVASVGRTRDAVGRLNRSIEDMYQDLGSIHRIDFDAASRPHMMELYLQSVSLLLSEIEDHNNRR